MCQCIRGGVDGHWFSGSQSRCYNVKMPPGRWWETENVHEEGETPKKKQENVENKGGTATSAGGKKWKTNEEEQLPGYGKN